MTTKQRVALIGCGQRAYYHVPALQSDERCSIIALSDINPQSAEALSQKFDLSATIYTDYEQMVAQEKPDLVVACLWTPLHLPVFKLCATQGVKAFLSEKPMAPTWGDCLEMAGIAAQTGCQLSFCYQRRYSQNNRQVRQWIREGRFGDILRMDLYSPPNLLDCGTHTFDQMLSYLNEAPVKWVLGAVDASHPINWFNVSAEEMAVGTIVLQNGIRAQFQNGGPDMDIWGGVRVIGSKGFIEATWDGIFQHAALYDDPSWKPIPIEETEAQRMSALARDILDCLESGQETDVSYQKALRANEIVFALYESVRRHARITLPLTSVTDNPFVTMLANGTFQA